MQFKKSCVWGFGSRNCECLPPTIGSGPDAAYFASLVAVEEGFTTKQMPTS